jgi:RNA polymerase sigma-70 factor (ECF subfamily)
MSRILKHLSDEYLLDRLQQADPLAFEEIYERYWSALYRTAYHKLNSKSVAEELVQDLFATLWQKRAAITVNASLQQYLFGAIRNNVISHVRKCAVREKYSRVERPTASNDTEWKVAYNELAQRLDSALDALPEKTKAVFAMSRYEEKSVSQIARQLNFSEKGVEYHLTKALKHLRTHLQQFLFSLLFFINL